MNKKRIAVIVLLAVAALLLWWLLKPSQTKQASSAAARPGQLASPSPASSPVLPSQASGSPLPSQPTDERRKAAVENILGVLAAPITFYGKVIDQNGDPVPDAAVGYSALDKFMAPGTGYTGTSDENGKFSIAGIKGARLSVNVRKKGYYFIDGKSNAAFAYGTGPDGYFKNPPTEENPAIFILHKMGTTEPLIRISSRTYRIPKNGTPVQVDLTTGQVSSSGNLCIEAWTDDLAKDAQQHYNWRCRVSVPNGGLIERKGQFDFEAPESGYQLADEIVMSQTAEEWQPQAQREYFVKLADGRYARIQFKMIAQGNHFFRLESYLNPAPGSRNLEYDPKKSP